MGLREWLLNAQTARGATEDFAKSASDLRKMVDQQDFANALPSLVAQGDTAGIVGAAAQAGDTKPLEIMLTKSLEAKNKTQSTAKTDTQIRAIAPTLSPTQAKAIAALPAAEQDAAIKQAQTSNSQTMQQTAEGRRNKQFSTSERHKFQAEFDKAANALRTEETQMNKVRDALKAGNVPADAVVFNYLARALAGEKGPLSDSDVARFQSRAFQGDMAKFQNFLSGGTTTALTPDQRKAYTDLVAIAVKNFNKYKDEVLGYHFAKSAADYPSLVNESGDYDEAVKVRAKKFGYVNKDGAWVKTAAPTVRQFAGNKAALAARAAQIPDEQKRKEVLDKLEISSELTEDQIKQVNTYLDKFIPKPVAAAPKTSG